MSTDGATTLKAPASPTSGYDRSAPAAPRFSLALGAKKTGNTVAVPSRKRPRAALGEEAVEEEGNVHQEISTFGRGAETVKKTERIIQSIPNADWQDPSPRKKQKSALPGNEQARNRAGEVVPDKIDVEEPKFGLNVIERSEGHGAGQVEVTPPADDNVPTAKTKTADEEALEALTNGKHTAPKTITPPSEDDAFRDSYDEAPDAPSAQDFAATPVEGFGAAILRGYLTGGRTLEDLGYNEDGQDTGPKRRAGLLGLGAKESGLGVELGAWGKGAKAQKGDGYIPLARKNQKTGEMLTDEELKAKLEQQEKDKKSQAYINGDSRRHDRSRDEEPKRIAYREDKSSRREKYEDEDDRRRERRHDRDDRDDRWSRHNERDRDYDRRRLSKDRGGDRDDRHRRRHRDRYSDEEDDRDRRRRREREKERHRR